MRKFTALYHSSSTDETMSLHAAGCRDIKREREAHGSNEQAIEAVDANGAVDIMLDEELREMGYDENSVKVHTCTSSRKRSGKESTMTQTTIITTLDKVEVGQFIRPVPGTYKSRLTRTQRSQGGRVATITFGEEFAGSKFAKVTRRGAAKRVGTFDLGFGAGQSWHAYPGTVKVEVRTSARSAKQQRLENEATTARKRTTKAKAEPTKAAPVAKRTRGPVDEKLAAKVKKLRDEQGMAWWKIGVELSLPGSGPLPKGKAGAGQARKLYKAANGGTLPASSRSEGGSRTMRNSNPKPAARKRAALGLAELSPAEIKERIEGRTITYRYDKEELGEADPQPVLKIKKITLTGKQQRLAVTFWSQRTQHGFGDERTVYVDQITEVS